MKKKIGQWPIKGVAMGGKNKGSKTQQNRCGSRKQLPKSKLTLLGGAREGTSRT